MVKYKFYLCLEHVDLLDSAGVSLANHWDDVDLLVDLLHHLHIQRLESMTCQPIRDYYRSVSTNQRLILILVNQSEASTTGGSNEVEAGVDSLVFDLTSLHTSLSLQVTIKLILNIVQDGSPALSVVHRLSEARSINHCQRQLHSILNQHPETFIFLKSICVFRSNQINWLWQEKCVIFRLWHFRWFTLVIL